MFSHLICVSCKGSDFFKLTTHKSTGSEIPITRLSNLKRLLVREGLESSNLTKCYASGNSML